MLNKTGINNYLRIFNWQKKKMTPNTEDESIGRQREWNSV
jgi:hypothetical protein